MKRKGFTLLEVIIAVTCFFLLLAVIINIYTRMIKIKYNIQARTNVIQDSYYAVEKINLLLKDYTIDYEEYFNRKNVWCDVSTNGTSRNVWDDWHCDLFTSYGNYNHIDWSDTTKHQIYYCTSQDPRNDDPNKVIHGDNIKNGSWCEQSWYQSYWEYARQFRDVKNNVDSAPSAVGDEDDENIMKWLVAIQDASNTQELYLISQDGKSRILIRRSLIESGDRNQDSLISGDSEKLYTLQILKLKWFDAGDNHDFDVNTSSRVYDGKIDTWACDYAQGFICHGSWMGDLYSGYKLPLDQNDGRADLFQKNITIADRNLMIYPIKNPQYALAETAMQINPYFTIDLTSKLYGKIREKRLGMQNIDDFKISIQTSFDTKNFYTK